MSAPLLSPTLALAALDPLTGVGVAAALCAVVAALALWRLRASRPVLDEELLAEAAPDAPAGVTDPGAERPDPAAAWSTPAPGHQAPLLVDPGGHPTPRGSHRGSHRGAPRRGVGYVELSRSYAALGGAEAAARAQWAADLRLVGPLMAGHGEELPPRLLAIETGSPRAALEGAREEVRALMAGSEVGWSAPPILPGADHIPQLPSAGGRSAPATPATPDSPAELRERAAVLMERAERTEPFDPHSARVDARRADLASLDAVLLESARRYGDETLVSVELRQQLAAAALHDHDHDGSTGQLSLGEEVRRTRDILRSVVEPHELPLLEELLAPEPPG